VKIKENLRERGGERKRERERKDGAQVGGGGSWGGHETTRGEREEEDRNGV
jgi:hypothetical protein